MYTSLNITSTVNDYELTLERARQARLREYHTRSIETTSNKVFTPAQANEMLQQQYARAAGRRDHREMKRLEKLIAHYK